MAKIRTGQIGSSGDVWTSFTPTTTGWSGTPTTVGRYMIIGKTAFVYIWVSGTSNATTATVTNLPATSANITNYERIAEFRATDNGSVGTPPGSAFLGPNTTTVNLFPNSSHGSWTSSGTKAVQGLLLIYETT